MSRDIRSFFTTTKVLPSSQKKETEEPVKKSAQRKRPIIIDSDSDDEPRIKDLKKSRSDKTNSPHKHSNADSKVSSKYFKDKQVSPDDIFEARPIKRDNSRNIIKKVVPKESKELHFDKEFESELLLLDDTAVDNLSQVQERPQIKEETGKVSEETFSDLHKIHNNNRPLDNEKSQQNVKAKRDQTDCNILQSKFMKISNEANSGNLKVAEETSRENTKYNKHSPTKLSEKKNISISKESPNKKSPLKTSSQGSLKGSLKDSVTLKLSPKDASPSSCFSQLSQSSDASSRSGENKCHQSYDSGVDCNSEIQSSPKIVKLSQDSNCSQDTLSKVGVSSTASNLWVERYKPKTTKQIIGQQGEKSCVNKLMHWLKNWSKNQMGNKKLIKPSPWAKNDDGAYFKAALLSGPPGVGKTTTAHLVCKELCFDVVEFNASDTRSKKLLHQEVSELLSTKSLSPFFTGGEQVSTQHVLLMDEVDGMAGNEDRGGVQELITLIKESRIPIICMCNDRNHPKIRSLANYCFDLRFSKPRAEQIRGAMLSMCFKEKLKIVPDVLMGIITSANQDIRLIINHLSMLSVDKSNLNNSTKHIKMGPWDVTRKIFSEEEHKSLSIFDKCDLFFHDYSVTPLFVQENYLSAVPHKPEAKNKVKKMELFAAAARSLSNGDLTEKSIRSHNAWSLLPVQAVFSSLVPGDVLEGHLGGQINFPAWFGKNSRQTKMSRLIQELTVHSRLKISGNKEAMNLDYAAPLEQSIISPLLTDGTAGIPRSLAVLSEYCLVREDLESLSEVTSWPNAVNQFSKVESKVKAAFTRAYNKTSVPTPYAAVPVKKAKIDIGMNSEEGEQNLEEDDEEEEGDGLEVDSMIVVKKKTSNKKADKEVLPSSSKGSKITKRGKKK